MHRAAVPASVLCAFLTGCAPNNAVLLEGEYIAFLSEGTALSLTKEEVVPSDYDIHYNVDCREFLNDADRDALELEDPLRICGENNWPPEYEEWATQAGFRVVTETMDPWRGEALINSEDDLQIAFHHRIPGGADMRFVIAIDPDFGPTTCIQDPDAAGLSRIPLDGDWIGEWSRELEWMRSLDDEQRRPYELFTGNDLEGGRLFFLNAFGYQLNPADVNGPLWQTPRQWVAGAAQGRFAEENLNHRTPRYGEPTAYNTLEVDAYAAVNADDLWYCGMEDGSDPTEAPCASRFPTMNDMRERIEVVADGVRVEMERMTRVSREEVDGENLYVYDREADPVFSYGPVPHVNDWRIPDGRPAGFDGWGELHYNYIAFTRDSVLEVGGSARGSFALAMDAGTSSTRVFVKGKFEIEKIKRDKWTTAFLAQDKQIEAGIELCSAASEYEANPQPK